MEPGTPNQIVQIAVATDNDSGDVIMALTATGELYEQKFKTFYQARHEKGMYENAFRAHTKQVVYWEHVPLRLSPVTPKRWYEDQFAAQARENIVDNSGEEEGE